MFFADEILMTVIVSNEAPANFVKVVGFLTIIIHNSHDVRV